MALARARRHGRVPPVLFRLFFERRHRVLMAEVSGIFSSHDLAELDAAVIRFLSRDGVGDDEVHGLYDFSAVTAFAVPGSRVAERGQLPPILRGRRVLVAPPDSGEGFAAEYRAHQRSVANSEPVVAPSRAEAYRVLALEAPLFELVDEA